ncbi:MAG: acyltransferase [bacterium]|nr:acyltransferase [bacterium]
MNKRISYIDGLRGIACILVFVNHFLMAFFPASYLGGDTVSHIPGGLDTWYASSPVSVLTNGNFMVCVFFILSAYVLSCKILQNADKDNALDSISSSFLKRYFRLFLPVFCVCILILILSRLGLFFNNAAAAVTGSGLMTGRYEYPLSLYELFSSSFARIWFKADETFSNSFWMLSTLFIGGFLSSILSIMAGKHNRRMLILYGFFALIFIHLDSLYLSFVFGTALAYISVRHQDWLDRIRQTMFLKVGAVFAALLGLLFGGYPSGIDAPVNLYHYLNHLPAGITPYQFYHILGAFLLTAAVLCLPMLQKALSVKPILFLGNISFAIYLLNLPLIFSLSSGLLLKMAFLCDSYLLCSTIIFSITLVVLLLLSYLFNRFAESACNKITAVIVSFFVP